MGFLYFVCLQSLVHVLCMLFVARKRPRGFYLNRFIQGLLLAILINGFYIHSALRLPDTRIWDALAIFKLSVGSIGVEALPYEIGRVE